MRHWLRLGMLVFGLLIFGMLVIAPMLLAEPALAQPQPGTTTQAGDQVSELTLERVLTSFAEMSGFSASFTEKKEMDLLAKPLTSSGTLHYSAPDKLVRRTDPPKESTVLIDGDTLSFAEGGEKQDSINLNEQPVVRQFVDGFRHVLAGDLAALQKDYTLDFQTSGEGWTLTLTPTGKDARQLVEEVVVKGEGTALNTLIVKETIGDVTTTTFSQVQRDRTFTNEELEQLFSL